MSGPGFVVRWHLEALLHSYSQIVFAKSLPLGMVLLLVSLVFPSVGLSGIFCALATNSLAKVFTGRHQSIHDGVWGFGALMAGMFVARNYEPGTQTFLLILLTALLTLVFSMAAQAFLQPRGLPMLTLPFVVVTWVVYVFSLSLPGLILREDYIFSNSTSSFSWLKSADAVWLNTITNPYINTLFQTLAGVFFNGSVLAGVVVFTAVFFWSRLAAILIVLGYSSGFLIYALFGLPTHQLLINLSGANYIFSAMALGGFFLVGNLWSWGVVLFVSPILTALVFFLNYLLSFVGLSSLTLGFALTTISFLYFLKKQNRIPGIAPVFWQTNHYEDNLYQWFRTKELTAIEYTIRLQLPFLGDWWVSQDYEGKQTHLGAWRYALDFVIKDDFGSTWDDSGIRLEDYYCYNKPVLAPADGYIVNLTDKLPDNPVGSINMESNWGNSIVIQHAGGIYSQLSHLKPNSFKVALGQYVFAGQTLALCGNSGRSAEPHLHWQVQNSAEIGAVTLPWPVTAYFKEKNEFVEWKSPQTGQTVRPPVFNALLQKAFKLIPGNKFKLNYDGKDFYMEVFTDAYNKTYIWSHNDKTALYFIYDGIFFYATRFVGSSKSPLAHLFKAFHKVFMAYEPKLQIEAGLPVNFGANVLTSWTQDLVSPFIIYNRPNFTLKYKSLDNEWNPNEIILESEIKGSAFDEPLKYLTTLKAGRISEISIYRSESLKSIILCEWL